MAKLNRESRLRDKRADKDARKAARKLAAASDPGFGSDPYVTDDPSAGIENEEHDAEFVATQADASVED